MKCRKQVRWDLYLTSWSSILISTLTPPQNRTFRWSHGHSWKTDTPHTSLFSCTLHASDYVNHTTWLKCLHPRITPSSCHPWWAVERLFLVVPLFVLSCVSLLHLALLFPLLPFFRVDNAKTIIPCASANWGSHSLTEFTPPTFLNRINDRLRDAELFSRRFNARHWQTFYDLVNVYVFDSGSICIHGKELLKQFTFHQNIGENLTLKKMFEISEQLILE